jgi:hypothetical protein
VQFENGPNVTCNLNGQPKDVIVNGMVHRVRLGVPTRELNIDGKDYQILFGGSPITVVLNGINVRVQLEGPLPQVRVGNERRIDHCVGKIFMVIDATHRIPIFLDATPQIFHIDGVPHVLK